MAVLQNNLNANSDPAWVTLSARVGTATDTAATLTIGSEVLTVVAGAGTRSLYCDRGVTPAHHAVGATAVYAAGGGSFTPAAFVEPTTATPEAIATALIAAGLMESS